MTVPVAWQGRAFNQVPTSENRIHSDEVARAYGFRGALVPGVTVSAYLIHPAVAAWGEAWLARGSARCVVHSPVYDREAFRVELESAADTRYEAALFDERGVRCASASVALPERAPEPPAFRADPRLPRGAERPPATRESMEALRARGLFAMRARWDDSAEITRYLRDPAQMPAVLAERGHANPAFVLGLTNWVLAANVRMSPWLHLQTDQQNFRAIPRGSELVVEARIVDLFEKKGHEFVDVDVTIFLEDRLEAAARVRLRAIYRLREP
jgi:hypothetical protein